MLLFILITLSFVCASTTKCIERQRFKLLDCTDMSLKTTEGLLYGTKPWVYVLDLRRNLLIWINDTLLLSVFPNLQLVDLRKNPNIGCRLIPEFKVSVRVPPTSFTKQQPLLQMTSLPVSPTSFTTQQSLLQTTSLPVPSTSLLQTISSPAISMTLEQNHTLHSPHTAKDSEVLLIISVTAALTIGFIVLLCFYGCHRFNPRWSVWLHVQPPSQIELLSVTPSENNRTLELGPLLSYSLIM